MPTKKTPLAYALYEQAAILFTLTVVATASLIATASIYLNA